MIQSRSMVDFVLNNDAEIKCLQEYYNDSASVIYNTRDRLEAKQYNCAQSTKLLRINRSHFGVAIFSKFPIVKKGELLYATRNAHNRGVYADVLIHSDTVRIINVHLESNRLQMSFGVNLLTKWKRAQEYRTRQVDQVADFINQSPYPVILCGDLNSTPYSYMYKHLIANLSNAFESEGTGLGATYNHQGVKFLRIDHQFYSPDNINCESFETLSSITASDHFPIVGTYSIGEN